MKVLTLTEPWATLVAIGAKTIETRSWRSWYEGPLAIHSAKSYPRWARDLAKTEPFRTALLAADFPPEETLGTIRCQTSLLFCTPTEPTSDKVSPNELAFGDYTAGRWAWHFGPVTIRYGPVEHVVKGHLGLWEWEPCSR